MEEENESLHETYLVLLCGLDRLHKPISSFSSKMKKTQPLFARNFPLEPGKFYEGERAYARVEVANKRKARSLREGIEAFLEKHPEMKDELEKCINEGRKTREKHLYYGLKEGKRISKEDYLHVLTELGLSRARAEALYEPLIQISDDLRTKRHEKESSILIGGDD